MKVQIMLNGEPRAIAEGETLADLITALGHLPQSLATAVNGEFVARAARSETRLHDGDAVFTFQPITGG